MRVASVRTSAFGQSTASHRRKGRHTMRVSQASIPLALSTKCSRAVPRIRGSSVASLVMLSRKYSLMLAGTTGFDAVLAARVRRVDSARCCVCGFAVLRGLESRDLRQRQRTAQIRQRPARSKQHRRIVVHVAHQEHARTQVREQRFELRLVQSAAAALSRPSITRALSRSVCSRPMNHVPAFDSPL